MGAWQQVRVCLLVGFLSLAVAGGAGATRISGISSTVFEWFETGDEDTALVGYQYLQLNAVNIADKGYDCHLYGRLAHDFANESFNDDSRLYTAYVAKRDLVDGLDFRLGRQFLSTTAGASVFDGLYLSYDQLGPLTLEIYGGGDVKYHASYSVEDIVYGVKLSGTFLDSLDVGLSFLEKFDDGLVANTLVGFDAHYRMALATLYNETQYDYLSDRISYFLLGGTANPTPEWTVRAEYLYSLPVFSSTSIYSVFAVDEYQELLAEVTWRFAPGLRSYGRYTHEFYVDFDDADVFELGVEKIRTSNWYGYAALTLRLDDDGQDLAGVKVYGNYLFSQKIQAGAGAHLDVLERRLDEDSDETFSQRYWVDATYHFTKKVSLQGKVELASSDLWDHYFRGRIRLNVRF